MHGVVHGWLADGDNWRRWWAAFKGLFARNMTPSEAAEGMKEKLKELQAKFAKQ